jgi:hypothetical protein
MGRKDEAKAEFDKASSLNKAKDDENYKRIANGHPHAGTPAADGQPTQPAPPAQTQPNQ